MFFMKPATGCNSLQHCDFEKSLQHTKGAMNQIVNPLKCVVGLGRFQI